MTYKGVSSVIERSCGRRPLHDVEIAIRPIASLKPNPRNARTHPRRQIQKIAESIARFGFNSPVLIDENFEIIVGHGRVEAAKLVGLTEVPTVCLKHMSKAEQRAYALADNRLAAEAGWDDELLKLDFQEIFDLDPELDLTVTGFEIAEIDLILGDDGAEPDALDDFAPPAVESPAITRIGDLWHLGPHRILCGDAMDAASYTRLLDAEQAQMVFTDPPYNVPIQGHASGLGRVHHRPFPMGSGEMGKTEFQAFLTTGLQHIFNHSADGAIAFVCMDWRHLEELYAAAREAGLELKNLAVWVKTNAGMGSFYRSQHELIGVFKIGTGPHINSFELGQHGRRRTNVWTYPGVNSFGSRRDAVLAMHPTVKPVALVADAIKDCSKRNGLILDPLFGQRHDCHRGRDHGSSRRRDRARSTLC
jgi:DNA modification methylase